MRADLALIGFGHVGRRFARLLDEKRERMARDWHLDCRIVCIATRRHGAIARSAGIDALAAAAHAEAGGHLGALDDIDPVDGSLAAIDALGSSDADLRVVVETTVLDIRAGQPAIDHVRRAIDRGCDVVTANKGPAAFAYHALASEARRNGVEFLFEGAVMDGVPIFALVRETLPAADIAGYRGVVNSTTNHILTALERGEAFGPALARMQEAGIAEAEPSHDLDGWDAAAKAAALSNVLFDARITPHDVDRTGVGPGLANLAEACVARGTRLRLVAAARRGERPVVAPVELPADDLLANLRGTANALILDTDVLGRVAITQLDGGLTHTAYALLSDLLTIVRRSSHRSIAPR